MVIFKCKMCGGNLEVSEGASVAVCPYCDTEQTLPTSNDEAIVNLFNRANYLRLKSEFDKASETYEKILDYDNNQAEAHWGIVLCKYGIEYVDTGSNEALFDSKKPTCHRTQLESILTDADYLEAIKNADEKSRPLYQYEAKRINDIQKRILDVVKNEKPFDVFICYKERDENNQKTRDSVIANEIYHELTDNGLKVFYAAITLEDKLGEEYEPYIYAALSSAKVMLVLGTKQEYFNAVWVKNEWSRYLHMMKTEKDHKRTLIPCYRDMDAYDLPDAFSHLQALDMSGIAFMPDLIRNIQKLIGSKKQSDMAFQQTTNHYADNQALPLLKRAFLFLEDGDFANADKALEKVLDLDPENAKAYVGKLMVKHELQSEDQLPSITSDDQKLILRDFPLFEKALRFADGEYKSILDEYVNSNLEMWYNNGIKLCDKGSFDEAKYVFEMINDYKDAESLYQNCCLAKNELIYADANEKMKAGAFLEASAIFNSISDFKDSGILANNCIEWDKERRYNEALSAKNFGSFPEAEKKFEKLGDYRDSRTQKRECMYLENERIYNLGLKFVNQDHDFDAAIYEFKKIPNYKNSQKNIIECENRKMQLMRKNQRKQTAAKVGKTSSKVIIIIGIIVAAIIGIVLLFSKVIIPFIMANIWVFIGIGVAIIIVIYCIAKARE